MSHEQATANNFCDIIDNQLGAYEAMELVAYVTRSFRDANNTDFDVAHLIEKITRWPEIWVPALNSEFYPDKSDPRTDWVWYCNTHFQTLLPISVLEQTCTADECKPENMANAELKFPFLPEAE
jgi:hypothetical protein